CSRQGSLGHEAALHGSSGHPPWNQGLAVLLLQDVPSRCNFAKSSVHYRRQVIWWQVRSIWSRLGAVCPYVPSLREVIVMPPNTRYAVRLPPALDALVQERIRASGTPFAVLIREALSAYLADTPPTDPLTPPDSADTLREF